MYALHDMFNPSGPNDALKHYFTSLKTDLIFLQQRVWNVYLYETGLLIFGNLFTFSPTSNHLHPLQVENCDSNSRLVVDEDDNGKFRLEMVKRSPRPYHCCWERNVCLSNSIWSQSKRVGI